VAADRRNDIFEAFSQGIGNGDSHQGGTGLGLAISAQLADMMGGRIWVDTPYPAGAADQGGPGSVFHFTALFERAAAVETTQDAPSPAPTADVFLAQLRKRDDPIRVLLVEDNSLSRKLMELNLERAGCRVTFASNGREAVSEFDSANGNAPDLILMDINMPGMNGFEAAQAIRNIEAKRGGHVPIVALTAYGLEETHEKCVAAGMDGYLTKPIDLQKMLRVMAEFVPGADMQSAAAPVEASLPPGPDEVIAMERFRAWSGDGAEGAKRLARMCLDEYLTRVDELQAALENSDWDALYRTAHSLCGSLGSFGAERFSLAARGLVDAAKERDMGKAREAYPTFQAELDRLRDALNEILEGTQS